MISHRMHTVLVVFALSTAGTAAADVSKEACVDSHSKGQDARDQGKLSLARKLFLTCAQSSCPALVQGDCARFADDLTRMQPSLSFAARDGKGADLPDTTVYVDDVLTATRLDDGKPYDVDPGKHVVKMVHGDKDQSVTVVVGAGEKGRTVAVTFGEPAPIAAPSSVVVIPPPVAVVAPRKASVTTHPTGAKVTILLGGVLAVGGTTLGILGLSRVPANCTVSSHQCAAPPGDPSFDKASSAIRLSNIGWISAGVGVAAIAGGLVWYVQGSKTTHEDRLVAPWFTSESAGLAASGRF